MEKVYREEYDGKIVKGIGLPAFIHNAGYHLVTIKVYEDGVIDCWKKVDFDGFVDKVKSGWVVTQVPRGQSIFRFNSFIGKSDYLKTYIDEREFIKEVRDTLDKLQGRKTSSERWQEASIQYSQHPSSDNLKKVKEEYESIPKHLRKYILSNWSTLVRSIAQQCDPEPSKVSLSPPMPSLPIHDQRSDSHRSSA